MSPLYFKIEIFPGWDFREKVYDMYTEYQYNDELYHHGILGQKWGVRRYQNPDGTLTDAGKKRYAKIEVKRDKRNYKLNKKASRYDTKADKYHYKSEKVHAARDLRATRRYVKRKKHYDDAINRLNTKAAAATDPYRQAVLKERSAKYSYKSSKAQKTIDRMAKQTGYGWKAMRYSNKSNKYRNKADMKRWQIGKNNRVSELRKTRLYSYNYD